jgi:hypothetical protein
MNTDQDDGVALAAVLFGGPRPPEEVGSVGLLTGGGPVRFPVFLALLLTLCSNDADATRTLQYGVLDLVHPQQPLLLPGRREDVVGADVLLV